MSDAPADTATTTDAPETETVTTDTPDFSALADLELTPDQIRDKLANSRKWEERSKANYEAAQELERLKLETLPEQERLLAEAEAKGSAAATAKLAGRLVDAELRTALKGRHGDVDAVLEGLDRSKFLVDGEPDTAAIASWVDRIAPETETTPASPWPDLGQGANNTTPLGSDPLLAHLTAMVGPPRG